MKLRKKKYFCVVGFGKHAEEKILPSILKNKNNVIKLVTTKKIKLDNISIFNNLEKALKVCTPSTIFILTTPPTLHYEQIIKIISYNKNIFVEKPIFTSKEEAINIANLLSSKKLFVYEMLMYKHNILYSKFKKYWNNNKNKVTKIHCVFKIPSLPKGTFRDDKDIKNSILYDIGCYIISLIIDLNFDPTDYSLKNIKFCNGQLKFIKISFYDKNIKFNAEFGIDSNYENSIALFKSNSHLKMYPFFYGPEQKKIMKFYKNKKVRSYQFVDVNAFEKMFNSSTENLIARNKNDFLKKIKVNKILDDLSKVISEKNRY